MSLDPVIALTLRSAVTLLFVAAVAHKLQTPAGTRLVLDRYLQGFGAAGRGIDRPLFVIVVGWELVVVGACVWPSAGTAAGLMAGSTLLVYAFAMAINLLRGNAMLDCGCAWGRLRQPVRPALVARNALLAVLAFALTLSAGSRELSAADIVSVVIATLTALALYDIGNRLLHLDIPDGSKSS